MRGVGPCCALLVLPFLLGVGAASAQVRAGDLLLTDTDPDLGRFSGQIIRVDPETGAQELISSGGLLFNPRGIAQAAKAEFRTVQGQIEFWAKVGRAALDNPDLPASFIAESLMAMNEPREEAEPFVPRARRIT